MNQPPPYTAAAALARQLDELERKVLAQDDELAELRSLIRATRGALRLGLDGIAAANQRAETRRGFVTGEMKRIEAEMAKDSDATQDRIRRLEHDLTNARTATQLTLDVTHALEDRVRELECQALAEAAGYPGRATGTDSSPGDSYPGELAAQLEEARASTPAGIREKAFAAEGSTLWDRRVKLGLTADQLATRAGLSKADIHLLEAGADYVERSSSIAAVRAALDLEESRLAAGGSNV